MRFNVDFNPHHRKGGDSNFAQNPFVIMYKTTKKATYLIQFSLINSLTTHHLNKNLSNPRCESSGIFMCAYDSH